MNRKLYAAQLETLATIKLDADSIEALAEELGISLKSATARVLRLGERGLVCWDKGRLVLTSRGDVQLWEQSK